MSNSEKHRKIFPCTWLEIFFFPLFKKTNSIASKLSGKFSQDNENSVHTPCLKKLSNQEKQIIAIILKTPGVIFIAESMNEFLLGASLDFCEMTGYSKFDLGGKNIVHLPIWKQKANAWLLTTKLRQGGDIKNLEINISCKNNNKLPLLISSGRVIIDEKEYIIFSGRDITEQKKIDKTLQESEALYREIQRVSHLGHWKLNLIKNHLTWSDEIFNIFEIDKTKFEASYEIFLEYTHPEDREKVHEAFSESIEKKTKYEIVHRLLMPDGRVKYVNEHGHTKYDRNGIQEYTIGTVQDITLLTEARLEKKKMLQQLRQSQKLESLGSLTSGIAHDFNNILSVIMGFTELSIERTEKHDPLKKNLEQIYDAGLRAKDLVLQILTFCRNTENEKIPLQPKIIIRESVKFLKATLPSTISITENIESSSFIMADPTQMHQVIMNICTNAAHAMVSGEGRFHIDLADIDVNEEISQKFIDMEHGEYIKLTISDTGCGMTKETMDRIFEPFFTTKKEGEGTGLGLSVVYGIIKDHQGQVMLYSDVGLGTTFSIYFPIIQHKPGNEQIMDTPFPGGDEKILVIDDEKVQVDMIKSMLLSLGYTVMTETDPQKALNMLKQDMTFDLIITDMTMPNMTGKRLAAEIKEIRGNLPVIISSGLNETLLKNMLKNTGVKAVIAKPVFKQNMAKSVRYVLDMKLNPDSDLKDA